MAAGTGLPIPRLEGVPIRHQLWQGDRKAARVALAMLEAKVADSDLWPGCQGSPFEFIRRSIAHWVERHSKAASREQFYLDVSLSSCLDHFQRNGDKSDSAPLFLTVEPESAGYVVLGPTLRTLETLHPCLPATFAHLFLGSLNRWVPRVRLPRRPRPHREASRLVRIRSGRRRGRTPRHFTMHSRIDAEAPTVDSGAHHARF